MLLRSFLIALLSFSAGCARAPSVLLRIVDPSGFVNKYGNVIPFTDPKSDSFSCISPDDTYRFSKACRQGYGTPDVVVCGFFFDMQVFACSDSNEAQSIESKVNWSCLSPRDWNRLLTYCRRKQSYNVTSAIY